LGAAVRSSGRLWLNNKCVKNSFIGKEKNIVSLSVTTLEWSQQICQLKKIFAEQNIVL
jgi:ribosomal 50S subunit-recycling heat shock protein